MGMDKYECFMQIYTILPKVLGRPLLMNRFDYFSNFYSPIHTARWSRKIARKLPECLLCERKHVPGLIPGLIPGWGPSNIAGFSPGMSAVWTKAGSMP